MDARDGRGQHRPDAGHARERGRDHRPSQVRRLGRRRVPEPAAPPSERAGRARPGGRPVPARRRRTRSGAGLGRGPPAGARGARLRARSGRADARHPGRDRTLPGGPGDVQHGWPRHRVRDRRRSRPARRRARAARPRRRWERGPGVGGDGPDAAGRRCPVRVAPAAHPRAGRVDARPHRHGRAARDRPGPRGGPGRRRVVARAADVAAGPRARRRLARDGHPTRPACRHPGGAVQRGGAARRPRNVPDPDRRFLRPQQPRRTAGRSRRLAAARRRAGGPSAVVVARRRADHADADVRVHDRVRGQQPDPAGADHGGRAVGGGRGQHRPVHRRPAGARPRARRRASRGRRAAVRGRRSRHPARPHRGDRVRAVAGAWPTPRTPTSCSSTA